MQGRKPKCDSTRMAVVNPQCPLKTEVFRGTAATTFSAAYGQEDLLGNLAGWEIQGRWGGGRGGGESWPCLPPGGAAAELLGCWLAR